MTLTDVKVLLLVAFGTIRIKLLTVNFGHKESLHHL